MNISTFLGLDFLGTVLEERVWWIGEAKGKGSLLVW